MSDANLKGSCLCGKIAYEARGPAEIMARCHCVQCRKQSGAEFSTNGTVEKAGFRIVRGEASLRGFESSPGQFRMFCGECGSPLFKRNDELPDKIRLRLGCLDTDLDQEPVAHAFTSEKSNWTEIPEGIPQFKTVPGAR